jgi:uncharacterized CHY-type Zn-finger protein
VLWVRRCAWGERRLIRAGKKWFDCAECHAETADHALTQTFDMTFICKKCKKAFRKDAREFEDAYVRHRDGVVHG